MSNQKAEHAEDNTATPINPLNGMTKQKAVRFVNEILYPPSKGLFSDSDWRAVTKVFNTLRENGIDYDLTSSEYSHNEAGTPSSKRWLFEINFLNNKNRPTIMYGVLVAAGAGSVQKPIR